jgi:hypothetical protein
MSTKGSLLSRRNDEHSNCSLAKIAQMIQFATSANRCHPAEVASASTIRTGMRASVAARTTGSSGV